MTTEPSRRIPNRTRPQPSSGESAGAASPAPPALGPEGARQQVARYLGVVTATEEQLRDALILVAERHERNYEIARGATVLAVWSSEHVALLQRQQARYGRMPSESAELVRSVLLGGSRIGVVGELDDLCDLATLAERVEMTWTIVVQGAHELHDDDLLDVASRARDETRRQISWLRTQIEHEAPDAIAVVPDWSGQLAATLPKRPAAIASVPDAIWGPAVAAGLILLVGLIGVVAGRPWLLPSLGPSAALIALQPAHPQARLWNTIVGHILGVAAGFAGIVLAGAAAAPSPILDGQLVIGRVVAATIAIALTVVLTTATRSSHPPATATTLLVALGASATWDKAFAIVAGAVLLAIAGELIRRVRLERRTPAERMAPRPSIASMRLRRPLAPPRSPSVSRPR
ncbi:MAG TPA: HPP family protein [Candidatus Limnocylindrales bacterium]|nr:HPP family protein [Candidatus Limnocylindrales bacterium]